jgi:hypothetical protein
MTTPMPTPTALAAAPALADADDTAVPPAGPSERLIAAITAVWRAIQAEHAQVPDVVVVLGSGTAGRRGATTKLGHFAQARWRRIDPAAGEQLVDQADVDTEHHVDSHVDVVPVLPAAQAAAGWVHELFVGGEGLRRGPVELLATLLHEAAHALATARSIRDTSRGGRFHNQRFRRLATELGLLVDEAGPRGWAHTELAAGTADRYAGVLAQLAAALTVYRRDERPARPAGTRSTSRNLLAVCGCAQPRRIRVARATLDAAPILCGSCGEPFQPTDPASPSSAGRDAGGVSLHDTG